MILGLQFRTLQHHLLAQIQGTKQTSRTLIPPPFLPPQRLFPFHRETANLAVCTLLSLLVLFLFLSPAFFHLILNKKCPSSPQVTPASSNPPHRPVFRPLPPPASRPSRIHGRPRNTPPPWVLSPTHRPSNAARESTTRRPTSSVWESSSSNSTTPVRLKWKRLVCLQTYVIASYRLRFSRSTHKRLRLCCGS